MTIREKAAMMKLDSSKMASTDIAVRNAALEKIAESLLAGKERIFEANAKDMERAQADNILPAVIKRLKFSEAKLSDAIAGIHNLIALPDPLFRIQLKRQLDEGLTLVRETCPIGVIGVIFEARPDAMVQIASLCIKSGNCAILKGGSETRETNKLLFELIYEAALSSGLPQGCLFQAEQRDEIAELLACHESVDLLIPRGSNAFVQYIMNNTKIPVLGHADGICHIYVDKEADIEKAIPIILDAKTQYVSACNTVETLLVHKDILDQLMPKLQEAFKEKQVTMRGSKAIVDMTGCEEATEEDNCTEYLDYIISAKEVEDVVEAVGHINRYGSHHTDAIITENSETAAYFMRMVDSAGVYQNCSTRFADGYRYGFGAEVGISTSKLHARGPVGLEGLLSYKYKLFGSGQIVEDYAEGKASFHFKDLE